MKSQIPTESEAEQIDDHDDDRCGRPLCHAEIRVEGVEGVIRIGFRTKSDLVCIVIKKKA